MTMPSPCSIGMTDTRTSISRPRHSELDAAVLRQALLGDVQPGHDLQAADDRGLEAVDLRRRRLRLQHAVDAVADLARPTACDSMWTSLARASIASTRISFTSRTTDASCASAAAPSRRRSSSSSLDVFLVLLGEQAFDRLAADAEVRLDQPGDLLARGQHRLDRAAR